VGSKTSLTLVALEQTLARHLDRQIALLLEEAPSAADPVAKLRRTVSDQ
jgi:hypothetical protein